MYRSCFLSLIKNKCKVCCLMWILLFLWQVLLNHLYRFKPNYAIHFHGSIDRSADSFYILCLLLDQIIELQAGFLIYILFTFSFSFDDQWTSEYWCSFCLLLYSTNNYHYREPVLVIYTFSEATTRCFVSIFYTYVLLHCIGIYNSSVE